jgi:hypothetical protein
MLVVEESPNMGNPSIAYQVEKEPRSERIHQRPTYHAGHQATALDGLVQAERS